jgi:hypothetical protein
MISSSATGENQGFMGRDARGKGAVVMINSYQGWPLWVEIFNAIGREYDWPAPRDVSTAITGPTPEGYAGT